MNRAIHLHRQGKTQAVRRGGPLFGPASPPDLAFLVLVLALVAFGLIMLFSASYAVGLYRRGDAYTLSLIHI